MKYVCTCALLLGLLAAGATAADNPADEVGVLKAEAAGTEVGIFGSLWGSARSEKNPELTMPEDGSPGAMFGTLYMRHDRSRIHFATLKAKDGDDFDRVIVDTDGDKDLAEETVLKLPDSESTAELTLQIGDEPVDFKVTRQARVIQLRQKNWMAGKVKLGDNVIRAALVDVDNSASYGAGDLILLDLDNDGKFQVDRSNPIGGEFMPVGPIAYLDGVLYSPKVAEDGTSISLPRYEGATGKLAMKAKTAESIDNAVVSLWLMPKQEKGGSSYFMVSHNFADFPVDLPAMTYTRAAIQLTLDDGKKSLTANMSEWELAEGKTHTLSFGKPELAVTVKQQDRKLTVGLKTKGAGGLEYGRIAASSDRKASSKGPAVTIAWADQPDAPPIQTGNMEYG